MPEVEDDHIVAAPEEARAGTTGHNVRYVLAASTLGVAILFAGIFLFYFA